MPASIESLISSRSEGYCTLTIKEYSEIEQVLGALRKAELQVLEMKLMQPDLEEVFIKIVGSKSD
jgi:ABC-2 type transport system ATP-binding protein